MQSQQKSTSKEKLASTPNYLGFLLTSSGNQGINKYKTLAHYNKVVN